MLTLERLENEPAAISWVRVRVIPNPRCLEFLVSWPTPTKRPRREISLERFRGRTRIKLFHERDKDPLKLIRRNPADHSANCERFDDCEAAAKLVNRESPLVVQGKEFQQQRMAGGKFPALESSQRLHERGRQVRRCFRRDDPVVEYGEVGQQGHLSRNLTIIEILDMTLEDCVYLAFGDLLAALHH